ncbi:M20 family metallopeptidase [Sporolactobacillus shoreicorticis]|uniref:Peptidase M20 domain-containing protein 2 n=1 Tax=Sporolactobacillus shoreicorticis TaxID=1923877 RepID=A0ABW5RYK5_9BACL|nr:M20 family metallopeptidase [Sporolactobacillus shoreicorticis]MCO7125199.1 M20 family metallopeptidase [Sporolactobacillus shoreicorticis]
MGVEEYKTKIRAIIEQNTTEYQEASLDIHHHPEVSNHEFHSSDVLIHLLQKGGFDVKKDVAGHRTGFDARYKSSKPGPTIAFLAEYDALPGLGHGCGHNLFGPTSSLAGVAIRSLIDDLGGEIRVYGTPGEEGGENGSAKESFVKNGFFNDVDAALCVHPGYKNKLSGSLLANDPVSIEFFGKPAHAAGAPEKGINALDAIILTFNGINALRQQLKEDIRIHGIITHGGDVPNVIPDYASAKFYLRAATRPELDEVKEKVLNIVKGAALATSTTYKFGLYQNKVDHMILTPSFDQLFAKHLEAFKIPYEKDSGKLGGSSDVGNVSQVIPTIQPTLSISDQPIGGHTVAFKEAAASKKGLASIPLGAQLLALTALDLYLDGILLEKIKKQHAEKAAQ